MVNAPAALVVNAVVVVRLELPRPWLWSKKMGWGAMGCCMLSFHALMHAVLHALMHAVSLCLPGAHLRTMSL